MFTVVRKPNCHLKWEILLQIIGTDCIHYLYHVLVQWPHCAQRTKKSKWTQTTHAACKDLSRGIAIGKDSRHAAAASASADLGVQISLNEMQELGSHLDFLIQDGNSQLVTANCELASLKKLSVKNGLDRISKPKVQTQKRPNIPLF